MTELTEKPYQFEATRGSGNVSALLLQPAGAKWLLVLGHGSGAGMRHEFMELLARELAANRVATFRYQFPFMEEGKRMPNPEPISLKTVRNAVAAAREIAPGLSVFAGGKSYGGRMTSTAAAIEPLAGVQGIVFFGFPLHAPGKPSNQRAELLHDVNVPLLFLQGSRDKFAGLALLQPVCKQLGKRSTLHLIADADHSFNVPKRTNRTHENVMAELAQVTSSWADRLL